MVLTRSRAAIWASALVAVTLLASSAGAAEGPVPVGTAWSGERLVRAREAVRAGDPRLLPALDRLKKEAEAALKTPLPSVRDRTQPGASRNPRDYVSYAPYWWPDPKKPNGLPYVRRDGQVNPSADKESDRGAFYRVCQTVEKLGLAYFFTGDGRYAEKAAALTRRWFLDPNDGMTPHLKYAQVVRGRSGGSAAGVIEGSNLTRLMDGLGLIKGSRAWSAGDDAMLRDWLGKYYKWLTGSNAGHEAMAATNNLGSWYDVQAVRIALYLGRTSEIRGWIETHRRRRIGLQIEPDGRQPNELARARTLGYSIMNLEALFALARLAEQVGVDWWGYETADGRSLRGALQFLAPYADPEKPWRREEVKPADRSALLPLLAEGALRWPDGKFQQFLRRAPSDPSATWILLYGPEFAPQPSGAGSATAVPVEAEGSGRAADAVSVRP